MGLNTHFRFYILDSMWAMLHYKVYPFSSVRIRNVLSKIVTKYFYIQNYQAAKYATVYKSNQQPYCTNTPGYINIIRCHSLCN